MSPCRTKGDGGRVNKPGDKLEIESLRKKMATDAGILFFFWGPGRGSDEGGLFRRLSQQQAASSEQRRCSFQKTTSPSSGSTRRAAGCLLLAPPLCALDTSPRYLSAIPGQHAFPPPPPLSPISQKKRRSVFFFPPKLLKSTKERQRGHLRSLPLVSVKSLFFFLRLFSLFKKPERKFQK